MASGINNVPGNSSTPVTTADFSYDLEVGHSNDTHDLFQPISNDPVQPQGSQNKSLTSPSSTALKLADKVIYGSNQVYFTKGSNKADKVGVVAGQIRTVAEKANSVALYGLKATKLWNKFKNDNYKMPTESMSRAFYALQGISIATEGLSFIKSAGSSTFNAVRDIAAHKNRTETQKLLEQYNPETRALEGGDSQNLDRLKSQLAKGGPDLARTKKQTAVDRLTDVKNVALKALNVSGSALLLAEGTSKAAAQVAPGVGAAISAVSTIHSAIKTGVQVAALNNLAKAKAVTNDPLLKALAGHIKQERTILARKGLINTAIGAATTGASIGFAASGAGAPVGLIVAGAIGAASSVGMLAYDAYHNRQLAKAREQSADIEADATSLVSLAQSNIGVAEKAFLSRLRTSTGTELTESVAFLRKLGVTETTIKKLQLAPEKTALQTLQNVLYKDKLKFKGLQLKQTAKTLLHVSGLTALGKRIKAGSQWLKGKLSGQLRKTTTSTAGQSLFWQPAVSVSQPDKPEKSKTPKYSPQNSAAGSRRSSVLEYQRQLRHTIH